MNLRDIRTIKRLADIEAATARPISLIDIAAKCYLNECCAGKYLRILVAEGKMHVAKWHEIEIGRKVALYVWGAGDNAIKPAPRGRAELERMRIKRIKADKDAYDHFLSMHRGRYAARKAVSRQNSWMGALC